MMDSLVSTGVFWLYRGSRVVVGTLAFATVFGSPVLALDLPVACAAGLCGVAGPSALVSQGAASLVLGTRTATITQTTPTAVLNWQSFNISADGTVNFVQPTASSISVNRIFQGDASKIFGSLNSNGTVYLLNQNGFLFGKTAVVNVGGLLASSLNISADALRLGIGNASSVQAAAFQPYTDALGRPLVSGDIMVQNGATIDAAGGQVMLFAPNVENGGRISTPDGQTIIAAGQRVFLAVSSDPNVRGLLVEVGNGGTATIDSAGGAAGGVGEIIANRGNVTIAGLAVNQGGRVSATTTTRVNGSIVLQARDTSSAQLDIPGRLQFNRTGTLTLGPGSTTAVTLEGSTTDTAVDATAQPKSLIELEGGSVLIESAAQVVANSGNVTISAQPANPVAGAAPDSSRIYVAPDALIDVSGATVALSVEKNSLQVQLRGSELADNPAQRDGPLRGLTVWVDMRNHGVDANGNAWVGTPVADLTGDVSTIRRDVFERSLTGGTVSMSSTGSVIVSQGAKIDLSGGQIDWQAGYVKSSVLLGANGAAYNINAADPNRAYVGTLDSISVSDPHWGTAVSAASFGRDPRGVYTPGYVEGKDAGTLTIIAPGMILDGSIAGHATTGPLQRLIPTAVPAGQLYRSFDQAPLGGQLILGNSQAVTDSSQTEVLGNLAFGYGAVLPSLLNGAGAAFDPLRDVLPAGYVSVLSPDALGEAGISRLAVFAEGSIYVNPGLTLAPGVGGSVSFTAGRIGLGGVISAAGGSVSLTALPTVRYDGDLGLPLPGLYTTSGAAIKVGGEWVNDNPMVGGPTLPLFTAGGKVSLSVSGGSLVMPAGFQVDVSGGAQETAAGGIVGGKGGSISITDKPGVYANSPLLQTVFAPTLTGYALASGGSLAVALPALCLSSQACANPAAIGIKPSLLTDYGFAALSLSSTTTGLEVASDVNVHVSQLNLKLSPGITQVAQADSLAQLAEPVLLPDYVRAPASLTLASTTPPDPTAPHGDLYIAAGASISTDALGAITLRTDSRILDDGRLVAPGGTITLDVLTLPSPLGLRQDQALWLGADAVIDVSGTVIYTPSAQGLYSGRILGGGSISLLAEAGYLMALPGAELDARGSEGLLDIRRSSSSAAYTRMDVAASGGSITLFGAEGIQFDATMHADGGAGGSATAAHAPGGSLSVSVNGDLGTGAARSVVSFPSTPRVLTITATEQAAGIAEGATIPLALNGQGRIAAPLINAAGFDQIRLLAGDLLANTGSVPVAVAVGGVAFESGVTLSPRIGLIVNAPDIHGLGTGTVTLSAPYVALGSSDLQTQLINAAPLAGAATLAVSAGTLDLVGAFSLSGFAAEHLASSGDLRTVGVQLQGATSYLGQLVSGGALDLVAQQIYPTSLSGYTIQLPSGDAALGRLTIETAPGTAGAAYSAGGNLKLIANQIDDAGYVRAPFGSVSLVAPTVNLLTGSITSVSGAGLEVLFGETQGGLDWIYPLTPNVTRVYGTSGSALPPQKQLLISGATVNIATGAIIDVSGGGDLAAFEFTAGVGGTRDVLSNVVNPNLYAVLPGKQLSVMPGDPLAAQGASLVPGASVYLAGGNGLAAGVYTLLPARYALLPGAFLVKAVSGYTDISASTPLAQFDGSVVMSGYRVYGTSGLGDTRSSGFDVMPGSYAYKQASYVLTSANTFFGIQASSAGVPVPRLPQDAGSLAINATLSATLAGTVDSSHLGAGTRGANVDLSSANLYVSATPADAPTGYVTLDPTQLNALGAESLLLGGTRTAVAGGATLTVGSSNVIIAGDVSLVGQEILLAGRSSVQLAAGANVESQGAVVAVETPLFIQSGTALLRTSSGAQQSLVINGTGGIGSVTVAGGARLAGTGSVAFNSGGSLVFQGSLDAAGASVRLSSTLIGVGPVPVGFSGFALTPELIAGLASANLELSSPNGVQFFGSSTLALERLALLAPGLSAQGAGASLTINAQEVVLGGPTASSLTAAAGTGSLTISAATLDLSGGGFAVAGVTGTAITATRGVVALGDGAFTSAGTLSITTPTLAATAAVDMSLTSTAALSIASSAVDAGSAPIVAGAGGRYQLQGTSVAVDSAIRLPGGQIVATATSGDVTLGSHAQLEAAGFAQTFDGQTVSARGGLVSLTANAGNVAIDSGATIDVSAGTGSAAGGALLLVASHGNVALDGHLKGSGGSGASGAALTVDAASFSMPSLVALNGTAGFTGALDARLRGPGDLVLATADHLRTGDVQLTVDQGSITIAGSIDASGPAGHGVTLAASGDVRVNGAIRADATASATRGGTIVLESATAGVYLGSASQLSVGGVANAAGHSTSTSTGTVWVRLPRGSVNSVLNADPATHQLTLDGAISGATQVVVEGYQSYAVAGSVAAAQVAADPSNPWYADAAAFMANASAITSALGRGADPAFSVVPGLELRSTGDLRLSSPWDLSSWRFGDTGMTPGALTVRAAGSFYVDQSLSDGFQGLDPYNGYFLIPGFGKSWSYRLTAGADLASSQPLAVSSLDRLAPSAGNLVVAAGLPSDFNGVNAPTFIRTGTGFIDIAAGRDLTLASQASVIYTVGEGSQLGLPLFDFDSGLQGNAYGSGGGNVSIAVGRDVVGALSNQLYSNWLWRAGTNASSAGGYNPSAWLVSYGNFEQGIGAFGGGDVSVVAGRNVLDLGANVTTTGVPIGDGTAGGTVTKSWGSGLLRVAAGGDIRGGKFLGMADGASLTAGGSVMLGSAGARSAALNPVLALGGGVFSVESRRTATVETVLNPTLMPRSTFQPVGNAVQAEFYSTYTDKSLVSVTSTGGNVVFANRTESTDVLAASLSGMSFNGFFSGYAPALHTYAPNLTAVAMSGSVVVQASMDLWPSPHGTLNLFGAQSVLFVSPSGRGGLHVTQSDMDPGLIGVPMSPGVSLAPLGLLDASSYYLDGTHALGLLHGGAYAEDGLADAVPNRIVALSGDVALQPGDIGNRSMILSAKPIDIYAGRDIRDLGLNAQNIAPDSVDSVVAGRDIIYDAGRSNAGLLLQNSRSVDFSGPGEVLVQAGRDLNLLTSFGLTTSGNLSNTSLPSTGADLSVIAGVRGAPQYAAFIAKYLVGSAAYDKQLSDYLTTVTGTAPLSKAAALAAFQALGQNLQAGLIEKLFLAELRTGGRSAAAAGAGHNDYSRAFAALETLFPGSNPDLAAGQTNPDVGDILLYFSRIYTLSGGNIDLYAPGGQINVGLAAAPSTFGISKTPAQLGIVAQGTGSVSAVAYTDVQVNQSRVFAANGGNILIWSTEGNIDAGRGAKTAISAPPPVIRVDSNGQIVEVFPAALTGSGIQTIATSVGTSPGDVDLFAPHGVVNANDAGIVAGNLTIGATAVLGAGNISFSGTAVGVPVQSTGLGASLAAAASSGTAASGLNGGGVEGGERAANKAPLAETALNWLEVFVLGLGEDVCRPDDVECMRRQRHN
ncbi:MAG: filamentous hemagglutinin family protein [Pseudomonadota bacterium]